MRKKVKKFLAGLLMLILVFSTIFGGALSVFAENNDLPETLFSETEESTTETTAFASETWDRQTDGTVQTDTSVFQEPSEETDSEYFYGGENIGESAETGTDVNSSEKDEFISEEMAEYQPENQPYGIVVKARAAAGVLPEGTFMTVEELTEGSEQHKAAEEALEASNVEFDGFKALDISFIDAWGNKIEPEDGAVQVSIELDTSLLPEEASQDTLAIQHLDETNEQLEVQTVADAANGTVAVEDGTVKADFMVESFSTFTITWTTGYGSWAQTYFEITVHCVNTNGGEIEAPRENLSLKDGTTIDFSKYAPTASGLKYKEARYGNPTGESITALKAESTTEGQGWSKKSYNAITFVNGDTDVASLKYETTWGSNETTKKADVYLIYETDVVTPPSPETLRSLTKSKTVELNDEGTYDLNLTVSGAVGSINNKAKMDILLIIDRSGSMNDNGKLESTKKAISGTDGLIDIIESNKNNIDARYAVVSFSSSGYIRDAYGPAGASKTELSWSSYATDAKTAVNSITANGGTNYQSGIRLGKTTLNSARSDAQKIVIFLTDGLPTYRLNASGDGQEGQGNNDNGNYNINAAIGEVKGMSCNAFYAIGFGSDFTNSSGNTNVGTAGGNLNSLCVNVGTKEEASKPSVSKSYAAANADQLYQVFREIASEATSILCDHVSVTDSLSENVEVLLKDGEPSKLLVTVTDKNGQEIVTPATSVSLPETENNTAAIIEAKYETGQLKLIFPETYKLEPGWTYKLTTTIEASEKAYEKYREAGNYPDLADANTGTHSGEYGFYSNDSAVVNYIYNGENRKDEYDHPVIQLHPGTLVIEKIIKGLENDDLNKLAAKLVFEVTLNGEKSEKGLSQFKRDTSSTDKVKYIYRIEGLSPDTTYSVKEKDGTANVEAYDWKTDKTEETGSVEKDETKIASFTNTYTPSTHKLTVEKKVSGNMGEKDRAFTFTLQLKKNQIAYTDIIKDSEGHDHTPVNGKYTFTLKKDEAVTFIIPYGCEYEIEEETPEDYTMTVEGSLKGTITEDTKIIIKNDRTIGTPTGVYKTVLPYIMMIFVAIDAIICFVVLYLKKRIR